MKTRKQINLPTSCNSLYISDGVFPRKSVRILLFRIECTFLASPPHQNKCTRQKTSKETKSVLEPLKKQTGNGTCGSNNVNGKIVAKTKRLTRKDNTNLIFPPLQRASLDKQYHVVARRPIRHFSPVKKGSFVQFQRNLIRVFHLFKE